MQTNQVKKMQNIYGNNENLRTTGTNIKLKGKVGTGGEFNVEGKGKFYEERRLVTEGSEYSNGNDSQRVRGQGYN